MVTELCMQDTIIVSVLYMNVKTIPTNTNGDLIPRAQVYLCLAHVWEVDATPRTCIGGRRDA